MSTMRRSLFAIALSIFAVGVVSSGIFFIVHADSDRGKVRPKGSANVKSQPAAGPEQEAGLATAAITTPVINEIDADTPGADVAEFVEIRTAPGASLNGYVLVFFNGSLANDGSYFSLDLDGFVADGNGLVLIGNVAVPGVDSVLSNGTLQNGQDAVALYLANGTDFPNGTSVSTTNLVDAVVYDTGQADDPELLTLLIAGAGRIQIDETSRNGGSQVNSVQRCSEATRDGRAFRVFAPTANGENACPQEPPVDMDGDGRSDFVIIRDVSGSGFTGTTAHFESEVKEFSDRRQLKRERLQKRREAVNSLAPTAENNSQWWVKSSATGSVSGALWGNYQDDVFVSADFDGDNKDDLTTWRSFGDEAEIGFYWVNSSNFTANFDAFGIDIDDPTVVGDYDGDGIDDRAVFRCPNFDEAPGPCHYFFRSSANPGPVVNYLPWGYGTIDDFFPCAADYDGDGRMDVCVQRIDPDNPVRAQYVLNRSSDNQAEFVSWGGLLDFIIPGDFDGDGRSDFCARREQNGVFVHYIRFRTGATEAITWGGTNAPAPRDVSVPGDYDGDGATDIAIWRPIDGSATGVFWIRQSSGGFRAEPWGIPSDYPLANFNVR